MNTTVPDFVLIAAAVAPAVVLLFLLSFYPKSPLTWLAPRPLLSVLLALTAGVGSAFLALGVENLLTYKPWTIANLSVLALFALLVAGLAEEGAKYLAVRLLLWPLASFREPYDGILYCGAVGLGFGAAENISYVLEGGLQTALTRALTAVPFHCLLGVVLGWWLGRAKVRQRAGEWWGGLHLSGLVWAIAAHGLYDFFAFQSGLVSVVLLFGLLAGMGVWGVWAVQTSRGRSPGWGGVEAGPVGAFVAGPVRETKPVVAGMLGLVPGLGQLYNGELSKGFFLLLAAGINLFFLAVVWLFLNAPLDVLNLLMAFGGLSLAIDPIKLILDLSVSPVLEILIAANLALSVFSAVDAYRTSKSGRFDYLQAPELRGRFVQSFSTSYIGHLLAVFLFILVPVLTGAAGGKKARAGVPDGGIEFDLVEAPKKLDGFTPGKPEGTQQGTARRNVPRVVATKPTTRPIRRKQRLDGGPPVLSQAKSQAAREAKGLPRSYNEYLSWKIRRFHDLYFDRVQEGEYTVVRYEIDAYGTVTNVEILYDHTNAPQEVAELAADTVRSVDPALPLPEGVQSVVITELFWDGSPIGAPGSLESRLSQLPDGREVMPYPPRSAGP